MEGLTHYAECIYRENSNLIRMSVQGLDCCLASKGNTKSFDFRRWRQREQHECWFTQVSFINSATPGSAAQGGSNELFAA